MILYVSYINSSGTWSKLYHLCELAATREDLKQLATVVGSGYGASISGSYMREREREDMMNL